MTIFSFGFTGAQLRQFHAAEFARGCRQPIAALLAGFRKGTVVFATRNDRCLFVAG
jgi:hypothetical protein